MNPKQFAINLYKIASLQEAITGAEIFSGREAARLQQRAEKLRFSISSRLSREELASLCEASEFEFAEGRNSFSVVVSWGDKSQEVLLRYNENFVVDDEEQLLAL